MTDLSETVTAAKELQTGVNEFFTELERVVYFLKVCRLLSLLEEERRVENLRRNVEGTFGWFDREWQKLVKEMESRLGKPDSEWKPAGKVAA